MPLFQINDVLDEILDDSDDLSDDSPTPPKVKRRTSASPTRRASSTSSPSGTSGTSAARGEHEVSSSTEQKDFKTPRNDHLTASRQVKVTFDFLSDLTLAKLSSTRWQYWSRIKDVSFCIYM